jgi:FkbH-like protein
MIHNMMPSYLEIQSNLNQKEAGLYPAFNISILRNIIVEPIEPYLRYLAYNINFEAKINFNDYDTIFQDAVGGNAQLLNSSTDCIIIFTKMETLSPLLAQQFPTLKAEYIEAEIDRIDQYISTVLNGIRRQTNAMILWMGFETPINPALGILDVQTTNGQTTTIQRLNNLLIQNLSRSNNSYFVDLNLSIARIGISKYADNRYWHIGQAPFTREALSDIASESFKFIRALKGKNKKCLILDCDNTLWGGIIGEDGLSNIKLSASSYPGSSFYEFQQEILNLYHRGILIALCSKNNESEVWDVFQKHPDMILNKSYITTAQINWNDKASNIRQIANDLNIGLDSLVFVDDSEFEINLVRELLPEVECIHLPIKKPTEYRSILSSCGLFDTLSFTSEDQNRGMMYRAEQQRKEIKNQFVSVEEYHSSLEMVAEFRLSDSFLVPRVAQLTQKTNQFNLTTKRYSEADIIEFASSDNSEVICLSLKDKFGDYGIVGVCIITYGDIECLIDSFLISCRALGRYVEDAFMAEILNYSKSKGCEIIRGNYVATSKNTQVSQLYKELGFVESSLNNFCLQLSDNSPIIKSRFAGKIKSQLPI